MPDYRRSIFLAFSLLCLVGTGACVIANIVIDQQITWSTQSSLSIIFGWVVISPIVVKKHGITLSLCSLTIFAYPFLYLLEIITLTGGWLSPLGLPVAITAILTLWAIWALFSFIRINLWFKFAITVFLAGVIAGTIINIYIDMFLDIKPSFWKYFLSILSCDVVAALLGFPGYLKVKADYAKLRRRPEPRAQQNEDRAQQTQENDDDNFFN